MAYQLALKTIKLGDHADTSKNFLISTPAISDGSLTIEREGGTDVLSIDVNGDVTLTGKLKQAAQSMVRVQTANGYGSTNTVIRRFTTILTNQGSDITYADSATLGASFTINTPGVYALVYNDLFNAIANMGASLNSNQLTTGILGITAATRLGVVATGGADFPGAAAWTGYLNAGDVVRAHNQAGTPVGTIPSVCTFTIVRVA